MYTNILIYKNKGTKHGNNNKSRWKCKKAIEALLKHDNPKGNKLLNEIDGTIDTGEITDSVKLKKDSYRI